MLPLTVHTELNANSEITTTVIGELDLPAAATLHGHLSRVPFTPDVLDLRFVSFLDVAGLDALLASGVDDLVTSPAVDRLLTLCGLGRRFSVRPASAEPWLHHASFGVAVLDGDLRYRYVNDALERINGFPAEVHIGRRMRELFEARVDDVTPQLEGVLRTRAGIERVVDADIPGGRRRYRCRYHPAFVDGAAGIVAVIQGDDAAGARSSTLRLQAGVSGPA